MTHASTTELADLSGLARDFFTKEVAPRHEEFAAAGEPDRALYRRAGDLGLLLMSIPEEFGGGGATFAHEAVLFREQAYAGDLSMQLGVHAGIVPHYLNAYATAEQKLRWLPKLASGEWIGAIAMTEPGTGSDLQAVKTTAKKQGNAYVINGQKTFITNGQAADLVIVVARTGAPGAKGISLIVVETAGAEGYRRGRNLDKIGLHASDTSELFFDNVTVPPENLLGNEEGNGFAQLMQQLPQERLSLAIGAVASMERAVKITADYTKARTAFGKPLIEFQNTAFTLAERKTEAMIARVFVDWCVERLIAGDLDTVTASMAKWWCSQKQVETADECLQLHGGYGYMQEYPISRMFIDSRIQKIYGGTNEIMKVLIARSL